jgi:hypothetical protein
MKSQGRKCESKMKFLPKIWLEAKKRREMISFWGDLRRSKLHDQFLEKSLVFNKNHTEESEEINVIKWGFMRRICGRIYVCR